MMAVGMVVVAWVVGVMEVAGVAVEEQASAVMAKVGKEETAVGEVGAVGLQQARPEVEPATVVMAEGKRVGFRREVGKLAREVQAVAAREAAAEEAVAEEEKPEAMAVQPAQGLVRKVGFQGGVVMVTHVESWASAVREAEEVAAAVRVGGAMVGAGSGVAGMAEDGGEAVGVVQVGYLSAHAVGGSEMAVLEAMDSTEGGLAVVEMVVGARGEVALAVERLAAMKGRSVMEVKQVLLVARKEVWKVEVAAGETLGERVAVVMAVEAVEGVVTAAVAAVAVERGWKAVEGLLGKEQMVVHEDVVAVLVVMVTWAVMVGIVVAVEVAAAAAMVMGKVLAVAAEVVMAEVAVVVVGTVVEVMDATAAVVMVALMAMAAVDQATLLARWAAVEVWAVPVSAM